MPSGKTLSISRQMRGPWNRVAEERWPCPVHEGRCASGDVFLDPGSLLYSIAASHLEGLAIHDLPHHCRETIIVRGHLAADVIHHGLIVPFEPATQSERQQLFSQIARKGVGLPLED